jgi:hypothetical protein
MRVYSRPGRLASPACTGQRGTARGGTWPCEARRPAVRRSWARRTVRRERRRVHSCPWSTARDSRRPYARPPCGRHAVARLGACALAPERGEDAVGALFYFICATSKMHNSIKCQLTSKSPKSKVVEEL